MGNVLKPRQRGILSVRADASNPNEMLASLQRTFEAFKASHEEELKGIKKNFADVVTTEKVDRINSDITTLTKALDEVNTRMAALRAGGGTGDIDPAKAEHRAAFNRFFRRGVDADLRDIEVKAALSTDSNPDGGYLAPATVDSQIERVLGTVTAMRRIARVMPIGTNVYKSLKNMGGAGGGWVTERGARTETATPTLREMIFTMMELYAEPAATQTMLDDASVNIESWLADEVMETFTELEAAAFITGDGQNQPKGILSYETVANASYAWGKLGFVKTGASADFGTVPVDNIISLYYALKSGYRQNASWLMSDPIAEAVRKFKDGDGNLIWRLPDSVSEVSTIMGKPVYTDDNMPDVGANKFPIAFGDFKRGYLILDRQGVRVLRDPFTAKPYVLFYTTKRVGGGVNNFEAIKLLKCST